MAHGLNSSQLSAVQATKGAVLVLAGAGSGKTRVITFRIVHLIRQGISPEKILAVTFTNKAAREMKERTEGLLQRVNRSASTRGKKTGDKQGSSQPHISTFHSLCVRILRHDIESLGYRKRFTIYDRSDQEGAARKALRDIHCATSTLKPSDLLWRIGNWKQQSLRAEAAGETVVDETDTLAAMAYKKYELALKAANAVDFDDLLLCTEELFRDHPDVLARHQKRFDYVMVDEYQDTNATQYRIISSLVAKHGNLCVVGDDDQAIYGWRGARMENILEFDREFPDATIVRLEENYRCRPEILELANCLIAHNTERRDKTLKPARGPGKPPRFLEIDDEVDEATYVAREIRAAVDTGRFRYKDVAILFRTNEQPRLFEQELRANKVPYVLIGGQSFFDRREVRDLISYLKVIANPDDELSLLRIINRPARGIGDGTVSKLLERAVESGQSLWHVLPQATADGDVTLYRIQHASFVLDWNGQTIYVDPTQGAEAYAGLPTADIVLLTHGVDHQARLIPLLPNTSRWIVRPVAHMLDCCLISDAGGAMIVTSLDPMYHHGSHFMPATKCTDPLPMVAANKGEGEISDRRERGGQEVPE